MASNVAKLDFSKKTIEVEGDDIVAHLQKELVAYVNAGGKLCTLEQKCNGYPKVQTISNILSGQTKYPRFLTVLVVLKALGYRIYAVRKSQK